MFTAPEFWILISFVILFGLVGRRVYGHLSNILDERSSKIRVEVRNAENEIEQSRLLLEKYKQKHKEAVADANKIINQSKQKSSLLKRASERDLKHQLSVHESFYLSRINQLEQESYNYIKYRIINDSLMIVKKVLQSDSSQLEIITSKYILDLQKIDISKNIL